MLGLGLGLQSQGVTTTAAAFSSLADLLATDAAVSVWDSTDLGNIWQETDGTVAGAAGQPIGQLLDLKGSNDLVAATDALRPTATDGVTWGYAEQRLDFPGALPANITMLMAASSSIDTTGVLWCENDGSPFGAVYQKSGTAVAEGQLGGDVYVDDVDCPLRGDAYTAITGAALKRVEHRDTTLAILNTAAFNGYPAGGLKHIGLLLPVAMLNNQAADYAAALVIAQAFVDEQIARVEA